MCNAIDNLIQDNLKSLCIKATTVSGGDYFIGNYYSWTKNQFYDWYNRIFDIRIPKENFERIVHDLRERIKKGLVPKFLLTGVNSLPNSIEKVLPENGFNMFYQQTGMAVDLQEIDLDSEINKFDIGIINNEEQIDEWVRIANEAFGKTRGSKLFKLFFKEMDMKFYFCRYQGRIISTAMLYIKERSAGIYLVGTLNDYREKGIASLIVKKALADAKQLGCNIGVLQASDMGKRIYEIIGFKEYGKISHWEYIGSPKIEGKTSLWSNHP